MLAIKLPLVLLQSGVMCYWDSVVQNAIGCTLGSFVAIGVSWLIFKQTFEKTEHAKKAEERRRKDDLLKYYKYLLEEAYKTAAAFNSDIEQFVQTVEGNRWEIPLLHYRTLNSIKRPAELSMMDEILFAFTERHQASPDIADKFSAIYTISETIHTRFLYLLEQLEKATGFDYKRRLLVRDGIESSKALLQKVIATSAGQYYQSPLLSILETYHQMKASNAGFDKFPPTFIDPLNTAVLKILNAGIITDDLLELEKVTSIAIMTYGDISKQIEVLAKEIKDDVLGTSLSDTELLKQNIDRYFTQK